MKKICFASLLSLVAVSAPIITSAATIEFVESEGYTSGVLNGQNDWVGSGSYYVPGGFGSASIADTSFATIYYGGESIDPSAGMFAYVADFNFTHVLTSTASIGFSSRISTATSNNNQVNVGLNYTAAGNFTFYYQAAGIAESYLSTGVSASSLGLTAGSDFNSDALRITVEMTKGGNETSWTLAATLYNITSDTVVGTITASDAITSLAFYNDSSLFVGFNSGANSAGGGYSQLAVDRVSVIPEVSNYALFLGFVGLLSLCGRKPKNRI